MAEYIEREALIANLKRVYCSDCNSYGEVRCRSCGTGDALDMIEDAPTFEVVRCKNCKYYKPNSFRERRHCILTGMTVEETDFCSYGERRDE